MKRLTDPYDVYESRFPVNLRTHKGYSLNSDIIVEKLGAYEDLHENNKLLILYCNVGDKVYVIHRAENANIKTGNYCFGLLDHPQEKKITSITVSKNGILYHVKDRNFTHDDIGVSVFTNFEDAMKIHAYLKSKNQEIVDQSLERILLAES